MRTFLVLLAFCVPAAAFAASPNYFLQGSTLRSHHDPMGPVCVANTVFFYGEGIVFHVKAFNWLDGSQITADQVERRGITATVTTEWGDRFDMIWSAHGDPSNPQNWYFAYAYVVPADLPMGTYRYWVELRDNNGGIGTFEPVEQPAGINLINVVGARPQTE